MSLWAGTHLPHPSKTHQLIKSAVRVRRSSPDKNKWGKGGYIKINTDYAGPYQVNFNQDYLLMGWGRGRIRANTWSSAVLHVTKKLLVDKHTVKSQIKTYSKAHLKSSAMAWLHAINGICCQVSRLSEAQRKHLSRALNRADNTWQQCDTIVTLLVFVHLVLLWQNDYISWRRHSSKTF